DRGKTGHQKWPATVGRCPQTEEPRGARRFARHALEDITLQPDPSKSTSLLASPEAWDLVADAYTTELLPIFERFSRDALRLAALPTSARVLDAAAGPGTLALLAAASGARVSAIDFSPAMIAQLRRRAAAAGLSGIDARLGDGQVLPF